MFSLPVLAFSQATGGSTCSKVPGHATKNTGGKKGAAHPELASKGADKKPPPASKTDTGRKGNKPNTSARKKPPSPAPKPPDQK